MLDFFQASTYTTTCFVSFLRVYYQENVCLLCSQIHRLYLHGSVERLVRNNNTFSNEEIYICVIICHNAKAAGRQYTKRMLPPFVIPECNITLENTLLMCRQMPNVPIDVDQASMLLGTYCEKTIRRHYWMVMTYTEIAVSNLIGYLTLVAPFIAFDAEPPYEDLYGLFLKLTRAVVDSLVKRFGIARVPAPEALYLHPVYILKKTRNLQNQEIPLNLSSVIGSYFDSS